MGLLVDSELERDEMRGFDSLTGEKTNEKESALALYLSTPAFASVLNC